MTDEQLVQQINDCLENNVAVSISKMVDGFKAQRRLLEKQQTGPQQATGLEQLSGRQARVFEFLVSFIKENGYSPSVREIGDSVELLSSSTVHGHLKRLEAKGYIKCNAKRGVTIINMKE